MSLITEYFELTKRYIDEYGENTVLLMQVGSFFEVYGIYDTKNDSVMYEYTMRAYSLPLKGQGILNLSWQYCTTQ